MITLRLVFFGLFWGLTALPAPARAEALRIGWQVPWATEGQIVMALKHTNISQVVGSSWNFVGFTYGGPLNQAALAGSVDVLFTADQPALTLLDKSDRFKIVARLMYNRTCLYVPFNSALKRLADLKGKSIAGPIGAAAERNALGALASAGVATSGIRVTNLDMAQQAAIIVANAGQSAWPNIDALFGFDPVPAIFAEKRLIRSLQCDPVVSVVLASKEVIEKRPDDLVKFLRGLLLAWYCYAQHGKEMNRLFAVESRLQADDASLNAAAAIEPNRAAAKISDIRLTFVPDDYTVMDKALRFLVDRNVIDKAEDYRASIDLIRLQAALLWPDANAAYARVKLNTR